MRICHVVDLINQATGGGSAQVPYYLAKEQAKAGHRVSIFASDHGSDNQMPPLGVDLRRFHSIAYLFSSWSVTPSMWRADFSQFDIVHLHNYRTLVNVIAAGRGVPYVLQAHGNAAPYPPNWSKPIWDALWRKGVFSKASGYIADAPLEVGHYITEGAPLDKITTIPVGVDMADFASLPPRRQHGRKRILFVGRLHRLKGAQHIITALALMGREDIELRLVGPDFGYETTLRQMAKDLKVVDKVVFLGALYGAAKIQEYVDADVYVMPSAYEMWGITLLEALACGTPAIISDKCEIGKILSPYCGQVVPLDIDALATAIGRAITEHHADTNRLERIAWARQFGWDKIAPKVMEFYRRVLEVGRGRD